MFGILLSITGGVYLDVTVNLLAAVLAVSTLLSYLLVYTPLKRKTPLCTLLGAFPGAMPTLIGWAGASAGIDLHAWFLFGLVFLWQFPHFLAIAIMYREDYARAGYKMLPEFDADGRFTRAEIFGFSAILVSATLLAGVHTGPGSLVFLSVAGALLLYPVINLVKAGSKTMARRVVHASVIYLPLVLSVAMVCKT